MRSSTKVAASIHFIGLCVFAPAILAEEPTNPTGSQPALVLEQHQQVGVQPDAMTAEEALLQPARDPRPMSSADQGRAIEPQAMADSSTGQGIVQPSSDPMATADSDMAKVLQKHQQLGAKPIAGLTAEEARLQPSPADAVAAVLKAEGKAMPTLGVAKRDLTYPTAGTSQPIRIYTPGSARDDSALPVIVYYHGGGWVIADIDTYESSAMALAQKANAIVASVDYRKAPEHKFPASHEDAFAAYQWVLANASSFGGDPKQVAVAGESAGGNLAANVAIMARDQGAQAPTHMLLIYPVADSSMATESYLEFANAKPLGKPAMQWFVEKALNPEDSKNPMIDLVNANLKGLPPATVITAQIDPLRSEGKALADRLQAAGSEVTYRNFEGVTHEFFGMGAVVADAAAAQDLAARGLNASFQSGVVATTDADE